MAIGKKAMYFTIMAIAFLSIFTSYLAIQSYYSLSEKMFSIESRVDTMDDFTDSVKKDIGRGLYISSFRALLTLQKKVIDDGVFIDDLEPRFEEAVLNGTLYDEEAQLMKESTFTDWIASISRQAQKINVNLSIGINGIRVYQENPWEISIDANLTVDLKDMTKLASWHTNEYITAEVSIVGFEDPLYILNFYGKATNIINKTIYDGNYTYIGENSWNVNNLLSHIRNSYYAQHGDAPSFLMRLEGDISSSPYGIESMINLPELSARGIRVDYNRSIVDYVYFSDNKTINYRTNMTASWIKIDAGHLGKYNVSKIAIV